MENNIFIFSFERTEKKYLVTEEQYARLRSELTAYMIEDDYGETTIFNIYYDTPDYLLIRRSLESPVYKEKIRLRTYGQPADDSTAFIEIKKKYEGTVYKRRFSLPYKDAFGYLNGDKSLNCNSQIKKEVDFTRHFYKGLRPSTLITYDRIALFGRDDADMRITFDRRITWRDEDMNLTHGVGGKRLSADGVVLMEIKCREAMPLWLTHLLHKLNLRPASFSKYGSVYTQMVGSNNNHIPGGNYYA